MGRKIIEHAPSPAMLVACIALAVALGGTSYAAFVLPANSVGAKQLRKNAVTAKKIHGNAVTGIKVKNDSLTGADLLESTVGKVPTAANADKAGNANALGGLAASAFIRNGQKAGGALAGTYPSPGLGPSEAWHQVAATGSPQPSFFPGWGNSPGTGETAAFYKDPFGVVHLKGTVRHVSGLSLVFQLPIGYRPARMVAFPSTTGNVGLASSPGNFVDITSDGFVIATRETSSTAAQFWALDGISFRVS